MKKTIMLITLFVLLLLPLQSLADAKDTYSQAQEMLAQKKYVEAASLFESLGGYEDSTQMAMYCKACTLCESGYYDVGIVAFSALNGFKDCDMRITYYTARALEEAADNGDYDSLKKAQEAYSTIPVFLDSFERILAIDTRIESLKATQYEKGKTLMAEGQFKSAAEAFINIGEFLDSYEKAKVCAKAYYTEYLNGVKVGNYITFGKYPQDNDNYNGAEDIEWLVLAIENNRLLVISKYGLESKAYHEESTDITWENSTLREWLNNDFFTSAFNDLEKAIIPTTMVKADPNRKYFVQSGNDTQDKVFLLSIQEANKYFASSSERKCVPTDYALNQGARSKDGGFCFWWLRAPGQSQNFAARVNTLGEIAPDGNIVETSKTVVRPAIWIELESVANSLNVLEEVVTDSHMANETISQTMILESAYALENGSSMTDLNTLTGVITEIVTPWSHEYKNITVTIVCDGITEKPIVCYRLKGENAEFLAVGDIITVTGTIENKKGVIRFDCGVLNTIVKTN